MSKVKFKKVTNDAGTKVTYSGVSLVPLLTTLFIHYKLTGATVVATWSWLWVLSPLWLPVTVILGIGIALIIIAAFIAGIATLFGK